MSFFLRVVVGQANLSEIHNNWSNEIDQSQGDRNGTPLSTSSSTTSLPFIIDQEFTHTPMGIERASRDGWHLTCCSIIVIAVDSIELTLFCKLMK